MRKPLIAIIVVGVIAAASIGGAELFVNSGKSGGATEVVAAAPSDSPAAVATAPATPASGQPSSVSAIKASYLPDGVALVSSGNTHGQQVSVYSLPGKANASTVPDGGVTEANALTVHVATRLTVAATAGYTSLPADLLAGFGSDFTQTWTTVQGAKALITQQANGYGTLRIDWVGSDGVYYTTLTQRLDTADGLSGLDESTLQQVANGVSAS